MEYYSSLDASQLDSETPTIFEIISAGQLESLLSPSLRYVLVYYASRYPKYLLRISNNFDEINLFIRSFIEWYFIRYWQGSFTENFYGLKRVRKTALTDVKYNSGKLAQLAPSIIEERRLLSRLQEVVSIFEITGATYISEKFNYWYEIWYPKYITNQLIPKELDSKKDRYKTILKRKFVEIYPTLQSIYRVGDLAAVVLYLSGNIRSPTLLTFLFNIDYARLNQYDYTKNEAKPKVIEKKKVNNVRPLGTIEYIIRFFSKNITSPMWKAIRVLLGSFFPVAIFTLKFLEWWNNSNFGTSLAKGSGDILDFTLPSPSALSNYVKRKKNEKKIYKSGKNCPLCKEEISNPAIIETGYVFCYSCIYNYLKDSHRIVSAKTKETEVDNFSDSDDENDNDANEDTNDEKDNEKLGLVDIDKGGRCPVTGKKLLGCKWNTLKQEWDIEGIRRVIF